MGHHIGDKYNFLLNLKLVGDLNYERKILMRPSIVIGGGGAVMRLDARIFSSSQSALFGNGAT